MIPLKFILPKPKEVPEDSLAFPEPFIGKRCWTEPRIIDIEAEVARMKWCLHMHPLIGLVAPSGQPDAAAAATAPPPNRTPNNAPVVPPVPVRGRRSSVGGDRAQAIAAQFEVSEPDDVSQTGEAEGPYPDSIADSGADYFDDISVIQSGPTTPRLRR
jgi:hypothetical protein